MKFIGTIGVAAAACSVCACGGGGGTTSAAPGTTTYAFVTPTLGARDTFTTTDVDDANNTIPGTYEEVVASVNSDGSYTLSQDDPSGSSLTVNGISYRFYPRVLSFDASGHETALAITEPSALVSCALVTQAGGHALPWYVGQSWTQILSETCNGASTTYSLAGQVASYESVTVPAGTFMALKLVSTQTWTDSSGQQVTETITHWADPSHSLFTVKSIHSYARSGAVPAHYVASETIELASRAR
jgi:hypothetical protein